MHLRACVPPDLTDAVVEALECHEWVSDLVVLRGVVRSPTGDLVECDLAREKSSEVLEELDRLGVNDEGSILLLEPISTPSRRAEQMEEAAPGHPEDAVLWDSVESAAESGVVPTVNYHVFLLLAVVLAAVAVVTDSAVLVVGAMVVGPEFAAVAAVCAAVVLRRWRLVAQGLELLVISFAASVVLVTAMALLARWAGLLTVADVTRSHPNTNFIWHPDGWSLVVALVAGAAGVLALAIEKTSTMVGVFISVTTVPAAGNLALSAAFWETSEMLGSLEQLGTNLAGMIVAGTAVLLVQRRWWPQIVVLSERWFRRLRYAGSR
ncbi:DUF389 domain-containing protein [Nocardioides sp. GY 10127]|nr:DUF389 domain-containing protein [Nocardioides sp. GY 10127]